ncbi:MAG: hypothetical protein ACLUHK_09540 [Eubacteriales bacterium]
MGNWERYKNALVSSWKEAPTGDETFCQDNIWKNKNGGGAYNG